MLPEKEAIGRFKYVKEDDIDAEFKKTMELLSDGIARVLAEREDY